MTLIDISVPIRTSMPIYELICQPLKLVGSDGAPARALLRTL